MKKSTKIWLIIAASLVLIGLIIFAGVMSMVKWDFKKLSTVKYETNNYEITEEYRNISIVTNTADIVFVGGEKEKTEIVCHEQENIKHSIKVKENTLVIELVDTRKWYEHIGISWGSQSITVYLPESEYASLTIKEDTGRVEIPNDFKFEDIDISTSTGNVTNCASASGNIKIKTSTGAIRVENISADSLDLTVSTGKITASGVSCEKDVNIKVSTGKTILSDLACKNLTSNGNTGGISLEKVIVCGKMSIERSTGDVRLDSSDAAEIFIATDTGDVKGSLLSEKVFIAKTDTGKVDVPDSVTGGRCEISTDTGDIKITVI